MITIGLIVNSLFTVSEIRVIMLELGTEVFLVWATSGGVIDFRDLMELGFI